MENPFRDRARCLAVFLFASTQVSANPNGAHVINGQVSFTHPDAATLHIANSPGAIVNWQQFSIQHNELTRFIQQSADSAILNRVVGQDPSSLLGQLLSNGRVFLINPNGIVFGQEAVIDTAGFIASTLDMTDEDFINQNLKFQGTDAANIENYGYIKAGSKGNIYLIAPNIENSGVIEVDGGEIILAAGESLTIASLDSDHIVFEVQAPEHGAINLGQILTNGGAAGMFAGTIKHSGTINANSIKINEQGRVELVAQENIHIDRETVITVNGHQGGTVRIETDTGDIWNSGTIEAKGEENSGGQVQILGERVALMEIARIDASGETGGGEVLIGGDYQGKNPDVKNAQQVYIGREAAIVADAITNGDGGKVIAWADNTTQFYGKISARGGNDSGNGGFVETSGKHFLEALGKVDASAVNGNSGEWLLDPINVTIDTVDVNGTLTGGIWTPGATGSSIANTTIEAALAGGTSVTVTTTGGLAEAGNITVNAPIAQTAASSATLTLQADNDIDVNATIGTTVARFNHDLALIAGNRIGINIPIYLDNNVFSASATTIAIDAVIDAGGNGLIQLSTTGNVTQSAPIFAGELDLLGAGGTHTLTHAGNQVGTVRMDTGSVVLTNNGVTTVDGFLVPGPGQETVLVSSAPVVNEQLGASIDVHGDVMVVGAPGRFAPPSSGDPGAAYVYRWNGTSWVFEEKLTVPGTMNLGTSVAVEGTHIVVGAPETFNGASRAGAAYSFEWNGSSWGTGTKLNFTGAHFESNFGWAVAIDNNRLVVSGAGNTTDTSWTGRIWFYDLVGSTWVEQGSVRSPTNQFNDYFGIRLDVNGNNLIAGSANRSGQPGDAYIYEFNPVTHLWDQTQQLTLGVGGDFFGSNVSISNDLAVVSKTPNGSAGSVYIYRYNGSSWVQEQIITASDVVAGDHFGYDVTVRDGLIIATSVRADLPGSVDAGAGYVFEYNGSSWLQESKITATTPVAGDWLGASTALSDQRIFFGAQFADPGGQGSAGAAHIYDPVNSGSTLTGSLTITSSDGLLLGDVPLKVNGDATLDALYISTSSNSSIDTGLGTLSATAQNSLLLDGQITAGDIQLATSSGLINLISQINAAGAVLIDAGTGNYEMTAPGKIIAGGDISISGNDLDINSTGITDLTSSGTVTLNASGRISNFGATGGIPDISASILNINAQNGVELDIDVSDLTITNTLAGNVIIIDTGGSLNANSVLNPGRPITIETEQGSLGIGSITGSLVTLLPASISGLRAITDTNGAALNVTAAFLDFNARDGFGTYIDPIEIDVTDPFGVDTTLGEVGIIQSGDLLLAGEVNTTGNINLGTTGGQLLIRDQIIASSTGDIRLSGNTVNISAVSGGTQVNAGKNIEVVNTGTLNVRGSDTSASMTAKVTAGNIITVDAANVSVSGGNADFATASIDPVSLVMNLTGDLTITGGTGNMSTTQIAADGMVINLGGSLSLLNGTGNNANATINGISLDINGGTIFGDGVIMADVKNNAGIIAPGKSPGMLVINGNYTQGANGTLQVELAGTAAAGTDYDLLSVTGTASLDGILDIILYGGFSGNLGDQFNIINSANIIGDFATINMPVAQAFAGTPNPPLSPGIYKLEIIPPAPTITTPILPAGSTNLVNAGTAQVIVLNDFQDKLGGEDIANPQGNLYVESGETEDKKQDKETECR